MAQNNPFAGYDFGKFSAFSLPPSTTPNIIDTQVSLPQCEDGYLVNELSSGAFGTVYQCIKIDNINYVYKHFSDIAEFQRVKTNLEKIIPMLIEKHLLNSTCFADMTLEQIFPETNKQSYKMLECVPLNKNIYKNTTEITKILNLIEYFNKAGFIHGDIKFDNIMKLNGKYVLTDLDDMCHIQKQISGDSKEYIVCTNNNSPMYTPLFVHPVYLWFRSELEKQELEKQELGNIIYTKISNTNLKENDRKELQILYQFVYSLQGQGDIKYEILNKVLEKIEQFNYDKTIYYYLKNADAFALYQCMNFNNWLGVVPELYNITRRIPSKFRSHTHNVSGAKAYGPWFSQGGFKAHAQKTSSDKKKVLGRERKIYKDGRKSYIIYKKEKMWLSDARALEKTIMNK